MLQLGPNDSLFCQGCPLIKRGKCVKLSISFPIKNETWRCAEEESAVPLVQEEYVGVSEGGEEGQFCPGSGNKTRIVSSNILGRYLEGSCTG